MTKRSKKEAEDLLQTHVLNLKEIRQATEKMAKIKYKRTSVYISLLGIFLIVFGLIFPQFKSLFIKETKKDAIEYATKIEKNTIICLSEYIEESNTYKIATKSTYTFDSLGLSNKESITTISMVNQSDLTSLLALDSRYKSLYPNANGVINSISVKNNILYFKQNITDYNLFDINSYNPEINYVNKTNVFVGRESMDTVKKKEILLGSSCS